MGGTPESYTVIKQAQALGVAPWELLAEPTGHYWGAQALAIQNAERLGEQDRNKPPRRTG